MYKEVDRISMGSPMGPAMANIFVGFLEQLFNKVPKLYCYVRYVDDTFACFCSRKETLKFLSLFKQSPPLFVI